MIIIDVRFEYINIINILKIITKYKLHTLICKPKLSKKFIKLLNFIGVEKENKTLIKKYNWRNYYNELNKLSNIQNLSFVDYIDIPITPIICKEFWYEYSY
jgi:hypothetical protein